MKPTSLLGLSLELIGEVAEPGPYPADARVGRFFRGKRFLGSRDRRFISGAVYSWLRFHDRARPRWKSWSKLRNLQDIESGSQQSMFLLDILALAQDGNFPWEFNPTCAAMIEWGDLEDHELDNRVRQAATDSFLDDQCWPEDPAERFAAETSMPPWLGRLLLELLFVDLINDGVHGVGPLVSIAYNQVFRIPKLCRLYTSRSGRLVRVRSVAIFKRHVSIAA